MRTFSVSFIKTIEVEAEDMDEAIFLAKSLNTSISNYDEIEVEEIEYEEDDEDDIVVMGFEAEDFESLGIGQYRGLED